MSTLKLAPQPKLLQLSTMVELVVIAKSAVLPDGEVADVAVGVAGGVITVVAKAAEYTPPEGVALLKTDLVW